MQRRSDAGPSGRCSGIYSIKVLECCEGIMPAAVTALRGVLKKLVMFVVVFAVVLVVRESPA